MNVRCAFCQNLYTLGRDTKLAALQHMKLENLDHYDAHCPRCRRATRINRAQVERSIPNWEEALKAFEAESEVQTQHSAELEAMQAAAKAAAEAHQLELIAKKSAPAKEMKKPEPKAEKKPVAKKEEKKPVAKKEEKKPAAKKPAAKKAEKKPAAKKPVAKAKKKA